MKKFFILILFFTIGALNAQDVAAFEFEESLCIEELYSVDTLQNIEDTSNLEQVALVPAQLTKKDPVLAWLISFPFGVLGLHRVYLGAHPKIILLYVATAGGFFGIIPMIDWIHLMKGIQYNDISKYVGNQRFLMWR